MPKAPDYPVGYGKPPKSTQFKKGQSGNPKGRPSGTQNLNTDVLQEMQEKIVVKEGGQVVTISKQRAMVKALVAKAIKGDVRAASKLVELSDRAEFARSVSQTQSAEEISMLDQEILAAFKDRILQTATPSKLPGETQ